MLTGLAVSIAFRMLFWNIGAEGQLVMGALATAWIPLFLLKDSNLPPACCSSSWGSRLLAVGRSGG
jgi:ABC-type uncharacterized transport system permease subunit